MKTKAQSQHWANAINTSFHTGCNNVFIYLRVVKLCDILG